MKNKNDEIKTLIYEGSDGSITITLDPSGEKTNAVFSPHDKAGNFDVDLGDTEYRLIDSSLGVTKAILNGINPDDPLTKTEISSIGFGIVIAVLLSKVSTSYMGKQLLQVLKNKAARNN
jgi:hypothetical protein